jgi:hypothetical protein
MLTLPPVAPATGWRTSLRLPRDHYIRLDSNDYSVHPAVIGRRIEVIADLERVRAFCDGKLVADHERIWGWHQTISDRITLPRRRRCVVSESACCARSTRSRTCRSAAWTTTTRRSASTTRRWRDGRTHHGETGRSRRHSRGGVPDPRAQAPTLRESVTRLADRARAESWSHEEFLIACLQREVSARESHGGEGRIRAARFPARKSIEEFDFDHARSLKRDTIMHLGTLDFVTARENVVFLGPPGTQ